MLRNSILARVDLILPFSLKSDTIFLAIYLMN